ncbi:MAG: YkoF family thiamine/hydroxymethylpyrimidine-binding protein [Bacteroidota bacterium]|uniref:Thiamine-binding protein n=1 Tax=Flagellimonas profundi TaxID=2915620 RepID=A0ABS3FF80_9FLAO|nr:YkoF family thiamine/hydroxymethylpyrimidine-binding protein [Allomuricauda profundi]MBO0341799.1 thiamine-binding protein [Allomuricauda profundi]MEC7770530.1 YkoF family thiamine/hydroxymethylpyrimidine-binding protein [Bacteroidota bacterium]
MKISVELTLSPLQDDFEAPIIDFIKKLRDSGLTILENPLSTQVFGDYDKVMEVLNSEIKESFENLDHVVLTMKVVKSDRSEYEPHF